MLSIVEEQLGPCHFREGAMIADSGKETLGRLIDHLTDHEIEKRLVSGGFSFASTDEPGIAGFVSNDRFEFPALKVPQSELSIVLPSKFGCSSELGLKVRNMCSALARHGECNLLFCADREHFDVRFDTELHLGIGLLDVYWINVLGPAFSRMIGPQRISASPAFLASYAADGYGIIQVTETLQDSIESVGEKARGSVKEFLGKQFFAKPRGATPQTRGVRLSAWQIWKVVGLFRAQNSRFKDISRKADVVPEIPERAERNESNEAKPG
jgi:hypothetical protein